MGRFLTALILVFLTSVAVAQTVEVPMTLTEPTFWDTLWKNVQGPLTATLTAVIIAVSGWIAVKVNTFFNVTNEAQQKANEVIIRNIIHDAAWSAIKYAQQKTGVTLEELKEPGMPPSRLLDAGLEYMRSKNPDVAAAVSTKDLGEIIVSKVPDLIKIMTPDVSVSAVVAPTPTVVNIPAPQK